MENTYKLKVELTLLYQMIDLNAQLQVLEFAEQLKSLHPYYQPLPARIDLRL